MWLCELLDDNYQFCSDNVPAKVRLMRGTTLARKNPVKDIKVLFSLSAGRCAFPGCRTCCIEPGTKFDAEVITGKIAHIVAHSDNGPRSDLSMSLADRDSYPNWILLCAVHHDIVDGQPNTYTVAELRSWKEEHEQWVATMLASNMPSVSFAELKVVALAIVGNYMPPSESFEVTAPLAKMARNGLTSRSEFVLTTALGKSRDVENFVGSMAKLDVAFPERLRSGFLEEYNSHVSAGLRGDELFTVMLSFATNISDDFAERSAGLAVLGYMFERCEVFEK